MSSVPLFVYEATKQRLRMCSGKTNKVPCPKVVVRLRWWTQHTNLFFFCIPSVVNGYVPKWWNILEWNNKPLAWVWGILKVSSGAINTINQEKNVWQILEWLIDCLVFYAVSAIFKPFNRSNKKRSEHRDKKNWFSILNLSDCYIINSNLALGKNWYIYSI